MGELTEGTVEETPQMEDSADPHRHLVVLYIITIIVSVATAFAFR
ncbi:MAG: hypothetical protein QW379_04895 [Thermoplasmata archaeon]